MLFSQIFTTFAAALLCAAGVDAASLQKRCDKVNCFNAPDGNPCGKRTFSGSQECNK